MRPERADPTDWLVSRAYGRDYRNYGEETNQEYDLAVEQQSRDADPAARLASVRKAQRILCDDFYMNQIGWGPSLTEVYNSKAFSGVVPVKGFGIASFSMFQSFLKMEPRRNAATDGGEHGVTGYDQHHRSHQYHAQHWPHDLRPACLHEPRPEAHSMGRRSWHKVDERTWDIKLRPGMQFHDGHPVTIRDLKFTFDFMMEYERANYWTANQFLEHTA